MSSSEKKHENARFGQILKLVVHLKQYRIRMILAILCGILHQLSIVAVSAMGAYIVGLAISGQLLSDLRGRLLILAVFVAARIGFYFLEMWLNHDIAFKVLADLRIQLFDAIERVSPAILLNMRSGQLASTLMSDVELLEWFFAHTFGSMLVAVIAPLILFLVLGRIHPGLALLLIPFVILMVWIPAFMKKKADAQGREVREQLGDANAVTVEGIQGMKEILTMNYRTRYTEKNQAYMSRFYESQLRYGWRLGTEGALLQGTLGISMLAVTSLAAVLILKGRIDASLYPFISILAGMVLGPVLDICSTARNFGLIFAAADRVYRVLEAKPQVPDTGRDMDVSGMKGRVAFSDVSFRYSEDSALVLKNVSFTIEPGETVALVGHSGAGKSTCMNLLMRYWDPEEGSVSIDGRDLRNMSLASLHDLTSAVLQDVYLFHISLRENIRLGRPEATDAEVEAAAKDAMAHAFIMQMPEGYDTIAGEAGTRLSGGQRQRIAIARALLRGSKILLLDEAVSSLDTENEKEIQESIRRSSECHTTVIVAHRLSTIKSADRVIVLKEGRVVQSGTYEELVNTDGYFRELIRQKKH
ncbi:MAG: ABC transporter ATP-binding protein [Blautia sp.]|nr:ABC transporter ATP-binding protein [Blautia sp.]